MTFGTICKRTSQSVTSMYTAETTVHNIRAAFLLVGDLSKRVRASRRWELGVEKVATKANWPKIPNPYNILRETLGEQICNCL